MNFPKKLVALAFCATMFGSAQASTVGTATVALGAVPAYAGGVTVAAEAVSEADYNLTMTGAASPLGNVISAQIRWIPTFGLNSGDVITFTFDNALYFGSDIRLIAGEADQANGGIGATDINGDADTTDIVQIASLFGALDTTDGVSSVSVRVDNAVIVPQGIQLILATGLCVDAGPDGICDDTATTPVLRIPAGTLGGEAVTVTVSAITAGNVPIGAAAATGTIADLLDQFELTSTEATSVADVAALRLNFLAETANTNLLTFGNAAIDTNLTQSGAQLSFANNNNAGGAIEDFILLDAGDILEITLTSSTNLDALDLVTAGANVWSTDGVQTTNVTSAPLTPPVGSTDTLVGSEDGATLNASGTTRTDDLVLTIAGDTVIADRSFTVTGVLTMDADVAQISGFDILLGGDTSHTWTTNGTVLESTYTNTNEGFNNRFVLSNTGTDDAPYAVSCLVEDGATCTPGAEGLIPGNGVLVLNTPDVITVSEGTNRATVIFTVEAPSNTIQGSTQTVKPGTGIEASQNMVRPATN